jgi:hypothetical protein
MSAGACEGGQDGVRIAEECGGVRRGLMGRELRRGSITGAPYEQVSHARAFLPRGRFQQGL